MLKDIGFKNFINLVRFHPYDQDFISLLRNLVNIR